MREYVYLSDSKLRQFLPEPRRFTRPGAVRLNSSVIGVEVDAPAPDPERDRLRLLRQVDRHIGERARWFAEPDLRPGQWVWFEAPLHCVTLRGAYQNLVLFTDPALSEEPDHERETGGCRLLLHGSVRHLRGYTPISVEGPMLEDIDGGSSFGTTFLTAAGQVVAALSVVHDPETEESPQQPTAMSGASVRELIEALDARHGPLGSAARMCGHARVTADLPATATAARCVVASPLTVEYAYDEG
ncbi:SAVMC3_10250 family protein [Streptomyces sp. NPDC054940]